MKTLQWRAPIKEPIAKTSGELSAKTGEPRAEIKNWRAESKVQQRAESRVTNPERREQRLVESQESREQKPKSKN